MSFDDPFDTAPADAEAQEAPATSAPAVVKSAAVGDGEGKIVSTYKEGAGYDASWTVVHAASVDDWFAIHDDPRFKDLLEKQKKVAAYFRGGSGGGTAATPATGGAPAGAVTAPNGETRFCKHGEMVYKTGISKAGKPYKLFSCTSRDRNDQCPAQWPDK